MNFDSVSSSAVNPVFSSFLPVHSQTKIERMDCKSGEWRYIIQVDGQDIGYAHMKKKRLSDVCKPPDIKSFHKVIFNDCEKKEIYPNSGLFWAVFSDSFLPIPGPEQRPGLCSKFSHPNLTIRTERNT